MITLFFLLIAITAVTVELCMAGGWVLARFLYRKEKNTLYEPTVSIIVPCKGTGKNFKENIQAIINQKYKNFRIIFVTDSNNDMAYILLKEKYANVIQPCITHFTALNEKIQFTFTPITKIHLYSNKTDEIQVNGSNVKVWGFIVIAM